MKFERIKKYLGEEWLDEQVKEIEGLKWVKDKKGMRTTELIQTGYFILKKIEEFIEKFESLNGFDVWVSETKNSKTNFKDHFFELMSLEIFLDKADFFNLMEKNESYMPEAFVKKGDKDFFLECTNLDGIPNSIENKVSKLFTKSRNKFGESEGIHLLGTFDFFNADTQKPTHDFNFLKYHIERRFHRKKGHSTIGFFLTNFFITFHPKLKKNFLAREYWLILNPNLPKWNSEEFKDLIKVDGFKIL